MKGIRYLFDGVIIRVRHSLLFRRNRKYHIKPFSYLLNQNSQNAFSQVEEQAECIIHVPSFFNGKKGMSIKKEGPSVGYYKFYDVYGCGGTNFIIKDDKIYADYLADDEENRIRFNFWPVKRREKSSIELRIRRKEITVEKAINLLGFAADNYYHLTFEIISRLGYIEGTLSGNEYTLLLDEKIKTNKNLYQLVQIAAKGYTIKFISEGQIVYCSELVLPSMNTWMPLNLKVGCTLRLEDNMIAKSAVENLRNLMRDHINESGFEKIFISRKDSLNRRIENEDEVIALFKENGFKIVLMEDYDIKGQIGLFSSAKCIVGASGAALTNLAYCNKETVVGCIIPEDNGFYIYSSIANYVGGDTLFFSPEIVEKNEFMAEEKWRINLDECNGYIKELIISCTADDDY